MTWPETNEENTKKQRFKQLRHIAKIDNLIGIKNFDQ